jgi:hypothetical protein
MNSLTSNVTAADMLAHQLISERVADAAARAEVRAIRAARRAARARRTAPRSARAVPAWRFGFLFPVH